MERILSLPITADFIKELGAFVQDNFLREKNDLSRLAFVFGGHRPALFLKRELSQRLKKHFFSPCFFSIDEFVSYALSKKMLFENVADLDACYLIYTLAKKTAPAILKGRQAFSQFLPWTREILGFIEQLDLEDISIKSLKDIQLHAAIGYDVPESINTLLEHIVLLRDAFHKVQREKRSYTRGFSYLEASRYIHELPFDEFDEILFCNFFYLHKTEEVLMKGLFDKQKAILVFQGDDRDWSVLERISNVFSYPIRTETKPTPSYELSVQAGFDVHSQACLTREILKTSKDFDKTVIVLPEATHLMPLLSEISSCCENFNVSLGYPLKRSSLYALFDNMFTAQETAKDGLYYSRDYLRVLSHPLVKNLNIAASPSATRILVHKIEEILLGMEETPLAGSLFISLEAVEELQDVYHLALETMRRMDIKVTTEDLQEILRQLHEYFFRIWEKTTQFHDFASSLEKFLNFLVDKAFLNRYPLDLKIFEKVFTVQEQLKNAAFSKEPFLREDIFKIFKNKLDAEIVSFKGSPLKGLQILGLFETRSLNFENVIILDANESILPKLKVYEPLIPRDVMLGLGLNRLEKEDEIQHYQLMRLISGAKKVYFLYQEREDMEKSRFIEGLIWQKQKEDKRLDIFAIAQATFEVKVIPKSIEIKKNDKEILFLEDFIFSASSINTYIHCPLRFYYQYILGLKEKEDLWDEPEAQDIGQFIHELLEETFKKFLGRSLYIDGQFKDYFFKVMEERFEAGFRRRMKSDAFLIRDILEFRLRKFLENEEKRHVKEILCLEKRFDQDIVFGPRRTHFTCRIDRIDRLQDNSLLVLDYKTGASDIMPSGIKKVQEANFSRDAVKNHIKSFQLPLYYYFVQQQSKDFLLNAAFYHVRKVDKEAGLGKLFKDEEGAEDRCQTMKLFLRGLECMVLEILNPEIPFMADEEDSYYCVHCPFFYLCR